MAFLKSLKDLPKGKRANVPNVKQIESAKKAKAINVKHKVLERRKGRTEVSLGTHAKGDVAGVVIGFRRKTKADFGVIIKDDDGNVIARTHTAKGTTTIAEQLIVKALSKYGKKYDKLTIVATVKMPTKKGKKNVRRRKTK
jgi:replicative superfamily II helicase